MAGFKVAVNRADRNKTKGSWIVSGKAPANHSLWKSDKCRFFAIPAELRNRIYEFVFCDVTILFRSGKSRDWRFHLEPKPGRLSQVVRCDRAIGGRSNVHRVNTSWKTSIANVLLVNKQAYREALPILYESVTFLFEPFKLARAFLRTISKANLESIRSITLYHQTQRHGQTAEAKASKEKANSGFANMCEQLATTLPNLTMLELQIELMEGMDEIVPDFTDPSRTFSVRQYERRHWVQALARFTRLKKLMDVNVRFHMPHESVMRTRFMCDLEIQEVLPFNPALGNSRERQHEQILRLWLRYFKSLHRSMGVAMQRMILRQPRGVVWRGHAAKLDEYRAFCWDPLTAVVGTLADRDYQKQLLQWEERYGSTLTGL